MKKIALLLALILALGLLPGCGSTPRTDLAATTLPVYQFTTLLCRGTGLTVARLVTESVSCLHDYTLQVRQMKIIEGADVVVLSGAGLEDFLSDALTAAKTTIDASQGISLLENHEHEEDGHHDGHTHEADPHIWLDPENAKIMAKNIARGLSGRYLDFADRFDENLNELLAQLDALEAYGTRTLSELSTRSMITFHDGFSYFARAFNLNILAAVEEESGSEASAQELKALITLTEENHLPAVFTEKNGADAAAKVISAATGAGIFTLDMAISGDDYFEAMYRNIDTVKEALA